VLLVEDDVDVRESIRAILEDEGFAVALAANGRDALTYLRCSDPPHVVVLDLMMPIMDGYQFLSERARDGRLATVPVVVLSADPGRDCAAPLGVVAILAKPIDTKRLVMMTRAVARSTEGV